jgi:hypothetical protein
MPVTVEDYQVPISVIFDYAVLLRGGQAVRLTRIQVKPSQVDDVIEAAGDALLFADPASGRMISEMIWRDPSTGGRPERRRDHPARIPRQGGQRYPRIP